MSLLLSVVVSANQQISGTSRTLQRTVLTAALTFVVALAGTTKEVERVRGATLTAKAALQGQSRDVERLRGSLSAKTALNGRTREVERLRGATLSLAIVTPPVNSLKDSIGGKPEKKRKHKKSYYENVDELVSALSKTQTEPLNVTPVINDGHLVEKKAESQYITAMAEAFERAGNFQEKSVSSTDEQEEIDRKLRINIAAIILLLD